MHTDPNEALVYDQAPCRHGYQSCACCEKEGALRQEVIELVYTCAPPWPEHVRPRVYWAHTRRDNRKIKIFDQLSLGVITGVYFTPPNCEMSVPFGDLVETHTNFEAYRPAYRRHWLQLAAHLQEYFKTQYWGIREQLRGWRQMHEVDF